MTRIQSATLVLIALAVISIGWALPAQEAAPAPAKPAPAFDHTTRHVLHRGFVGTVPFALAISPVLRAPDGTELRVVTFATFVDGDPTDPLNTTGTATVHVDKAHRCRAGDGSTASHVEPRAGLTWRDVASFDDVVFDITVP